MSAASIAPALLLLAMLNLAGAAAFVPVLESRTLTLAVAVISLLSAPAFWLYSLRRGPVFWRRINSELAAAACALWGVYLLIFRAGYAYWALDIVFAIVALLLWLRRERPVPLISAVCIFAVIGIRHFQNAYVIAALNLALAGFVFGGGARLVEDILAHAARRRAAAPKKRRGRSGSLAALLVIVVLAVYVWRPVLLMVHPPSRHKHLLAMAPDFPVQPPGSLSPPASALRGHVVELAGKIGERSAFQPDEQDRARDYVVSELRKAGYEPELQEYYGMRRNAAGRTRPYYNVEARLVPPAPAPGGAWVLSAHYDTAPGTPGADDNSSAVAVLLEAARALKLMQPAREIRFVAFGTEEPPSFTTRDMGSFRYMQRLKEGGVKVHGLFNLEMLGYYNPRPGAQVFPPFMHLFHPDTGDFVSLVSNFSSRGLMRDIEKKWRSASGFPIETAWLPSVMSALFISDHLNFWFSGERAVMLSDTAYFRNPYYHQYEDTPDKLDYERMAEVTRAVTAVVAGE